MAFEGHICVRHIFGNNVWDSCCRLLFVFGLVCTVMCSLYVDHRRALEYICDVGGILYSEAYANNVKCMYISVPHCIGFI